jgi:recombination protein RecR
MMVVERDSDVRPVERSGTFKGLFFILGGTVPLMSEGETKRLRGGALKAIVERRRADTTQPLTEVILAFGVNPDGENTARYIETLLTEQKEAGLTVTTLGRGLSTGSELEYADPETVKNALRNRA